MLPRLTAQVTVQSPVCASGVIGRFTWVPSAYRFIDSVPGVEVPVIVMPSVQSVSSSRASIVGAQDIVNVTSFDSSDSTLLFTAVAVNVCSPWLISSGTVKVTVQSPVCASGVMVRPVTWVPSAYRFIDSVPGVEVPVIVMPSVQSVSSTWASIVGAQDIVNVTSFDSSDSTLLFTAVAVNVCSPWLISSGTFKVTVQSPVCASGVMVRPVTWVPSAYRFIDSVPGVEVPVIVMPSVQSVSSTWASIVGAQDIVNVTSFDSSDSTLLFTAVAVNVCSPWLISSGTFKVTVQSPVCASGVMVRPVTWVPSAYRFIDSVPGVEVPVIVMPSVQSVSSTWASIVGAQDIVNVTSFDSSDSTLLFTAVAVNVCSPWLISSGTFKVTVQSPVCASGVMVRPVTWVPSAYRFIDSVPGVEVPVIVMPSVQSVSSTWASIVGAQDIVNVTSFDSSDSTLLFTAVAVNVCSPWLISSGTFKVTVQSPVCASGVMVRPVTWVPSAYRFIDSVPGVEVPVIVMPSVQSVSSTWASIVGAQDIVNVTSFDSSDSTLLFTAVAVNVCSPWLISSGTFKVTVQSPVCASGVMVRPVTWVPSAYRFIDSVPGVEVPVIVMPSVQSVSSTWASIVGAQDIVNVTSFDSSDSTLLFTAVAVNVCSPWLISSGTFKVTVQSPVCASGVMVRPVTWVPSAYRFIDSVPGVEVPVIVMPSVQSVSSSWASIFGAQDIVNVTSFDSSDSTLLFTAVAVNVCSPWLISSGTVKVTVQSPVCASGVIGRFTWVPSAYRFIDSVPGVEVPVIVMPSVQSVSSSWASIVGAQDIVNVTSFDSPDSTLLFTAVAVNVCSPWLISSGTVKVTVQSPVCASGVIGRFTWVPS